MRIALKWTTAAWIGFAAALALGSQTTSAQTPSAAPAPFPSKLVKIIVASAPGGQSHIVAQYLADAMRERLGGNYVVETKPGAAGVIAMEAVIKEPADGHTILLGVAGQTVTAPVFLPNFRVDVLKELRPIIRFGIPPQCLFVNGKHPAKSAKEFAEWARGRPDGVTIASFGHGSTSHLQGALFAKEAGFKMVHVAFRGSAPAIQEVAGGRVDAFIIDFAPAQGLMDAGEVRCLAMTGMQRWPLLANVPTFTEQGFGLTLVGWFGLFVPAATPDAVVEPLYRELSAMLNTDQRRKALLSMGLFSADDGPARTLEFQRADMARWKAVIDNVGIKPE